MSDAWKMRAQKTTSTVSSRLRPALFRRPLKTKPRGTRRLPSSLSRAGTGRELSEAAVTLGALCFAVADRGKGSYSSAKA